VTAAADVERTIRRLLALQFGEDEDAVRSDTALVAGLGADSMAVAELVAAIEDVFGIELDDRSLELDADPTVADLVRLVCERLGTPAASS
jgi:acyl carrier protein